MTPIFAFLPRTVIVLGLVSMLNDTASDMLVPLLPIFLSATLGASPAIIGFIEGLAEATASILKLISGWLADKGWNRRRLVIGGYTLSNVVRPLVSFATSWGFVILLRFFDRVGKGLRTAPRDAMIAGAVDASVRGKAFGFHRTLDHSGAMIGPLIAFILLEWGKFTIPQVFLMSAIPGVFVLALLIFGLPRETAFVASPPMPSLRWRILDRRAKALIIAAGGLALATAPEAFLILWASNGGLPISWVPLLWAAAHAIRALVAMPAGILSDRFGRLKVTLIGWSVRVVSLSAFAFITPSLVWLWAIFLSYAAATAISEGAERALIADVVPSYQRATAFGVYYLLIGLLALPGAVLFGVIWQWLGMSYAFMLAAILTAVAAISLMSLARNQPA